LNLEIKPDVIIFCSEATVNIKHMLTVERNKLLAEAKRVQKAIKALGGIGQVKTGKTKTRKRMSAESRRRIGLATKKRWAAFRAAKKKASS
jgi:hypothetical protein